MVSYSHRAQDLPPPPLHCDVCPAHVCVHLDQTGVLQCNNQMIPQRQRPGQLEHKHKVTQNSICTNCK